MNLVTVNRYAGFTIDANGMQIGSYERTDRRARLMGVRSKYLAASGVPLIMHCGNEMAIRTSGKFGYKVKQMLTNYGNT